MINGRFSLFYMHPPNAVCTGTDGRSEPFAMFHIRSNSSAHDGGSGTNAIYTNAMFTQSECRRMDPDGNCMATGKSCNAPMHAIKSSDQCSIETLLKLTGIYHQWLQTRVQGDGQI